MRAATTREREAVSTLRDATGDDRDLAAKRRDELSLLRDEIARQRDTEAAHTDAKDEVSDRHTLRLEELRARARATRVRAASDRERAARDRAQAARDRARQPATERRPPSIASRRAPTSSPARGGGVSGLEELENEIKRARRERTSLVVAYVDVDGLKAVNDGYGHAAGDEVLQNVAHGLRRHMRSYDLMVRMGGDEFLCALPDVSVEEAAARFGDLSRGLNGSTGNSVSIGFSELRESDSADTLVRRADSDLLTRRGRSARPLRLMSPETHTLSVPPGLPSAEVRDFLRSVDGHLPAATRESLALIASELVSNAVEYGEPPVLFAVIGARPPPGSPSAVGARPSAGRVDRPARRWRAAGAWC